MRKTETKLHAQARKAIKRGVAAVYDAVRLTLGPEGGNALVHRAFNRGSRITNDGVTVAQCIEPKDEFENLVATAFKEGAKKTAERAGDGTTSTIVVAGKIIEESFKVLPQSDGESSVSIRGVENNAVGVISLKKHLLSAIPKIKEEIVKRKKDVTTQEELENIIDVSLGGNRPVAKILADMVWRTGKEGFITLADGFKGVLETEVIEGARFPMKVAAARFLNHPERYEMVAEDCDVLVTNHAIDSVRDFADFWNIIRKNKLIIFAPSFSDEVLIEMVKAITPKQLPNGSMAPTGIQIFPVKCPSLGSEDLTPNNFIDLAIYCGARFIDKNKGDKLSSVREADLGFLEKLTVKSVEDREDAILLGGKGTRDGAVKIKEQIESLRARIDLTKMDVHKSIIRKRIASLASVGGIIRVGAPTEAEALPLKHKIEDAVFAGQAALRHGYVKGGGLCLKEIAEESFFNDNIIYSALCAPYNQIIENIGISADEFIVSDSIIDPARVVELQVEHGFGIAANLITVKVIIPEFDEHDPRDGYRLIADALKMYTMYWAKREGLYQGGIDESKREELQRQEAMIDNEMRD